MGRRPGRRLRRRLPLTARARPTYVPAAALPDRVREGGLFLPYLGLHSFQDSNDQGVDPGLRIGTLIGGFVNNAWSLNGLAELDILNPNSQAERRRRRLLRADVGPDLQPAACTSAMCNVEFVIGPQLGGWMRWAHASNINDQSRGLSGSADATGEGWTLGGNMGLFVAASPSVLVGALMSLEVPRPLPRLRDGYGAARACARPAASTARRSWASAFGVML